MNHREASDRAGAENQQRDTGDQARNVGVQNRVERHVVALFDRLLRRTVFTQFFTNTLVNQHVRVNRHTECQRHGRNTRQRQRCLQH